MGSTGFFLGKQENSNREGFVAYVSDRQHAVKWRNWKMHLIGQVNRYDLPQVLPDPKIIHLLADLKEERGVLIPNDWVIYPMIKIRSDLEESLRSIRRSRWVRPTLIIFPNEAR